MSGTGRAEQVEVDAFGLRVAVVVASWHEEVIQGLLKGALSYLTAIDAQVDVYRVPGSFEIPVVAARAAQTYEVVVALGVIVRGGTPHFEYVCRAVTDGLGRVALDSGTPVGFGILTTDTIEQAVDRAGGPGAREDKGWDAAAAAVETWQTLRNL